MPTLEVLSAGAAKAVVQALEGRFLARTGTAFRSTFAPAGRIRDRARDDDPFDVIILTGEMIEELASSGHIVAGSVGTIGRVRSGIAVRAGERPPGISNTAALKAALLAAESLFCPDTTVATSGIHFASVLRSLGIADEVAGRVREFPNGASAMEALARSTGTTIGCTQITEIIDSPGTTLVGPLPPEFELVTVYSAAVGARAPLPGPASELVGLLTGPASISLRSTAGFEVEPLS
jgi:molybdate transport system substrate-binding protein